MKKFFPTFMNKRNRLLGGQEKRNFQMLLLLEMKPHLIPMFPNSIIFGQILSPAKILLGVISTTWPLLLQGRLETSSIGNYVFGMSQFTNSFNHQVRRLMEEENKKVRKYHKKIFNDTVRQLVLFIKKRDKRVMERQIELEKMKKAQEEERKRKKQEEMAKKERELAARRKSQLEEDYDEIMDDNWEESHGAENGEKQGEVSQQESVQDEEEELYCIVCKKRFKSEKQWKNHEKSRKHLENVAQLRDVLLEEELDDLEGSSSENDHFEGQIGTIGGETLVSSTTDGVIEGERDSDEGKSREVEKSVSDVGEDDDDEIFDRLLNSHKQKQKTGGQGRKDKKLLASDDENLENDKEEIEEVGRDEEEERKSPPVIEEITESLKEVSIEENGGLGNESEKEEIVERKGKKREKKAKKEKKEKKPQVQNLYFSRVIYYLKGLLSFCRKRI